jgi:hypothetical protein
MPQLVDDTFADVPGYWIDRSSRTGPVIASASEAIRSNKQALDCFRLG